MQRHDNSAAEALAEWVDRPGNSQGVLAKLVEVSQPAVSQWIRKTARPEPHLRQALELLTGIPASEWDTAEERALVDRVRAQLGDVPRADTMPPPPPPPPTRRATSTRAKPSKTTTRARKRAA